MYKVQEASSSKDVPTCNGTLSSSSPRGLPARLAKRESVWQPPLVNVGAATAVVVGARWFPSSLTTGGAARMTSRIPGGDWIYGACADRHFDEPMEPPARHTNDDGSRTTSRALVGSETPKKRKKEEVE
ncbi:hypothetical protein KM043_013550 [Ampulex compressa]|nr:hypothetical protein KM043_013550 [Ampulex compressa]